MSRTVLRACVELVAWVAVGTALVLLLDTGRRDNWIFVLLVGLVLAFCGRGIVLCVRLDKLDNAFNRFSKKHEDAIMLVVGSVALLVAWTTTHVDRTGAVLAMLVVAVSAYGITRRWLRRPSTRA